MTHLLKSIGLAAVVATGLGPMAGPASAEPLQVEFRINASEPAEETYVRATRTADNACDAVKTPWLGAWAAERACELDLLDKFVAQAGRVDLARIHDDRTGNWFRRQETTLTTSTQ
ncbi:MAG: hypothetical protein AAFW65_00585 [Pseudomonadota bacterium]